MGQFYTYNGLAWLFDHVPELAVIGTALGLTSGSPVSMDTLATPSKLETGMVLTSEGTDLTSGTTVSGVVSNTVTMSNPALATASAFPVAGYLPGVDGEQLTLHLLTGAIPQGPYTTFSELTEANYDGYADVPVVFDGLVQTDGAAFAWIGGPCETFNPTDYTVPNTITGMAWTYPGVGMAGPQLVATEAFAHPVSLALPGEILKVLPILSLPFDCTAGPASPLVA